MRVTLYLRRPQGANFSVERLFADVQRALPNDIDATVAVSRFASKGFWARIYNVIEAVSRQGDVNHVTGDVHFLTYLLRRRRTILTILDCVMLERLSGFKRWFLWLLWYWLPSKRCAVITVISEATRQQVLRHLRCDPTHVRVIYCNVSGEFQPSPKLFNTTKPRVLQIGTGPNKNLDRVAAALSGLDCELAVIGELSAGQIDVFKRHQVTYENLVNLSREEVVEQYQRCDMLVFASTYEGFGLPIVEANAVGRPVVTSNLWSMPEVALDAACLVDPFDVASLRAGICRVIEDAAYRDHLVTAGFENVKRFNIETIAGEYAKLYRRVKAQFESGGLMGDN